MGILKDTITGIPRTAKRLGKDVGNIGRGIVPMAFMHAGGYIPGNIQLPGDEKNGAMVRDGVSDIGRAFHGQPQVSTPNPQVQNSYQTPVHSIPQVQNSAPFIHPPSFNTNLNQTMPPQHAALQGASQNVARALPVARGFLGHMQDEKNMIDSLAKGGPIKKTGVYKIHKGEEVLSAKSKALENKRK